MAPAAAVCRNSRRERYTDSGVISDERISDARLINIADASTSILLRCHSYDRERPVVTDQETGRFRSRSGPWKQSTGDRPAVSGDQPKAVPVPTAGPLPDPQTYPDPPETPGS